MLLHSEWVNLYVTASRVGSSFDGEPCLICLWLQRGLRHASCPCSALINGSGEREEGEKVCVWDLAKDFGVFHSLTILRDNPLQTRTHTVHTEIQLIIWIHTHLDGESCVKEVVQIILSGVVWEAEVSFSTEAKQLPAVDREESCTVSGTRRYMNWLWVGSRWEYYYLTYNKICFSPREVTIYIPVISSRFYCDNLWHNLWLHLLPKTAFSDGKMLLYDSNIAKPTKLHRRNQSFYLTEHRSCWSTAALIC